MKIEQANPSTLSQLWAKVEPQAQKAKSLEEAAQALSAGLYGQFKESAVLARMFLTVPFGSLPPMNKEFVQKLAKSAGAESGLKDTTPVLSLIGTSGEEADWNDRRKSKGHMGIPLISSAFVGAIPMISRLLKELGVPLDWIDSHDSEIIKKTVGSSAGLFFVDDAARATDHEGRKIIAAQDFVSKYKVKSVFGTGQAYSGGEMLANIMFCRDAVPRATAERFMELSNQFKTKSASLVGSKKIFAN
jgi:histone H3/H4